ncbi:MAG: mechanosensitive ion channel family protein [Krumholzibacteria bacterium]|nr:mechanosensitive ion channel family protein [Candidatus Krumholzibacteria bacterium]
MPLLDHTFLDNTLGRWALALLVAIAASGLLRLALAVVVSRLGALAARTSNHLDDTLVDALRGTRWLTLLAGGLAAGMGFVQLPPGLRGGLERIVALVVIVQVGMWATAATVSWLHRYRERKLHDDRGAATSVGAMTFLARLMIWSVTLVVALDNVGVDITALVTGLGIGGIAVALALQNVLGDLFASLSIVLDKPFVIGDFIIVGEHLGTVENVGLKTTRIRSLSGEQLVFSNGDLLGSRIRNFGRMYERRVVFKLGVTYGTTLEQLKLIPGIIREAIEEHDNARFDRSHFAAYGDFALQFESVYYVLAPDYNVYMDVQQAINLRLRERFDAEGIEFAFPTQTLHVQAAAAES